MAPHGLHWNLSELSASQLKKIRDQKRKAESDQLPLLLSKDDPAVILTKWTDDGGERGGGNGLNSAKPNKYFNTPTGHYQSEYEARRAGELELLFKAGKITQPKEQVEFELVVNGQRICNYRADFVYTDLSTNKQIVEDVKGSRTRKLPVYRLKKRLMLACLDITITEIVYGKRN